MATATETWAVATKNTPANASTARGLAQQAWLATMEAWQVTEVMQLGPAASSETATAGEDLRAAIYSWPLTNRCRVDQVTATGDYEAEDFLDTCLVNVKGLDTLEALLFSTPGEHACRPGMSWNEDGLWATLSPEALNTARAAYAARVAAQVVRDIEDIIATWSERFAQDLANAGSATSSFATQHQALNAIFDAMFYLETATKDGKIGPASDRQACEQDGCVAAVETPLAGHSVTWILANLDGGEVVFTGGEGDGLDDLLVANGHEATADAVLQAFAEAEAMAAALPVDLDQAIVGHADAVDALHAAIGEIVTLLKSDVAIALTLAIPREAAGDND
jgi:predicted lipoprotein